ncbi:MAG: hypothetical protein ABR955_14125 [Verrucomicrobiota bacterium]
MQLATSGVRNPAAREPLSLERFSAVFNFLRQRLLRPPQIDCRIKHFRCDSNVDKSWVSFDGFYLPDLNSRKKFSGNSIMLFNQLFWQITFLFAIGTIIREIPYCMRLFGKLALEHEIFQIPRIARRHEAAFQLLQFFQPPFPFRNPDSLPCAIVRDDVILAVLVDRPAPRRRKAIALHLCCFNALHTLDYTSQLLPFYYDLIKTVSCSHILAYCRIQAILPHRKAAAWP